MPSRSNVSRSTIMPRSKESREGVWVTRLTVGRNLRFLGAGWWQMTSTVLPSDSRKSAKPRAEPRASPSGFRWVPMRMVSDCATASENVWTRVGSMSYLGMLVSVYPLSKICSVGGGCLDSKKFKGNVVLGLVRWLVLVRV